MKSIAFTVLIFVVVIGLLLGLLHIYVCIWQRAWTRRTFRRMRLAGRLISRVQFEQHLAAGKGTVVFEAPTLGWRVLRVWWTADDVQTLGREAAMSDESPDAEEMNPSPFECWCSDTYVDLESGRAMLVSVGVFGGGFRRVPESIKGRFLGCRIVFVRSALIQLFRAGLNKRCFS